LEKEMDLLETLNQKRLEAVNRVLDLDKAIEVLTGILDTLNVKPIRQFDTTSEPSTIQKIISFFDKTGNELATASVIATRTCLSYDAVRNALVSGSSSHKFKKIGSKYCLISGKKYKDSK
jgi:hypothetical protein